MSEEVFWRYLPQSRRPRFTVVEYIILIAGLAIVVRAGLPFAVQGLADRRAAQVVTAVLEVEDAARRAAAQGDYDALLDTPPGVMPTGLENYLPSDFSFDESDHRLDWDFFEAGTSLQGVMSGERHGAIAIEIDDPRLRNAVIRAAGRRVWLETANRVTILVPTLGEEGSGG